MYISKALKGRLAQLAERLLYTQKVSQVRALYRPPNFSQLTVSSKGYILINHLFGDVA